MEAAGPAEAGGDGGGGAEEEAEESDGFPSWEECNVRGQWEKDDARCDSEKELFDVMELSWVFTQAAKLLRSVEIQQDSNKFTIITAASVITISESYPLSGDEVSQNRRDMRSGGAIGSIQRVNEPSPGIRLSLRFQGYPEGTQDEVFRLDGPNTMVRETTLRLDSGKSWQGKSVYQRVR
jgi:hypothetical protein